METGELQNGLAMMTGAMNPTAEAPAVDVIIPALDAERDIETLWLHARLARAHDVRRQWTEAAGHAAAVWLLDDDPAWASLEAAAGVNPANVTYLEQVAVLQTAIWVKVYGATSASIGARFRKTATSI